MITHEEALQILELNARESQRTREFINLRQSLGRILAEDIYSDENVPAFNNSAMDGFALRFDLIIDASPTHAIELPVSDCIAAGDNLRNKKINKDAAVEIMTGAPVPVEFDTVLKVEDVVIQRDQNGKAQFILISLPQKRDQNIRRIGEDISVGQLLLKKHQVIERKHLLALASVGIDSLKVFSKPRVAIISTGKELVPFCTKDLKEGQIRNSTGIYLESYLSDFGTSIFCDLGHPDNEEEYLHLIKQELNAGTEIFVSTGAVSMGQYDFIKPALNRLGAEIHFHKCAIRPGKPILFATFSYEGQTRYFFGIPGNPVSTVVGLRFFVEPFFNYLFGIKPAVGNKMELQSDVKKPEGFKCFFKGESFIDEQETKVKVLSGQASFMVSPLLTANLWVVLPQEGSLANKGTHVEVFSL